MTRDLVASELVENEEEEGAVRKRVECLIV